MNGPEHRDPPYGGHPEHLRIGDAERDAVTGALHEHFAQGRLTRDELDERLEAALSAKTGGDLRRITSDLPGHETLPGPGGGLAAPSAGWAGRRGGPWPGPPAGPWTGPWRPGPWGHSPAWRRRRAFPPLFPLLVIGLVVAAFTGFWVIKFVFLAWLVMAALHLLHRWRHHTGHGRARGPYGRRTGRGGGA